tara:strand:- start:53 stop:1057 length:1005 start_codon:yes stop_codon:yes gene_type:complete
MKNKIMAMLVAFGLVGSVSAIEINENLSINGFIDGSYKSTDFNDKSSPASGGDSTDIGIDEIELDFLFSAGAARGELHLDSAVANDDDQLDIEQVHLSFDFEGGLSLTAGVFGSSLGLDREDPGGLYTYSRAFSAAGGFNLGDVDSYQQEGLRVTYTADQFTASLSAFNGVGDAEETAPVAGPPAVAGSEDDLDWELSIAYTGIENLALGGGVQTNNEETLANADTTVINVTGVYTMGKALIGAEWSNIDSDNNAAADRDAYQILVDYDVSDVLGFAVRYAEEDDGTGETGDSVTIAPNYAISDNLGAILEYTNRNDANGDDEDFLAVELTFTF